MKFFSLEELNQQIWDLLDSHNSRKFIARPYSRLELFLEDEQQELRPLPQERFEIKYQSIATIMLNGHVQLSQDKNYYSVPYQYIKKKVKLLYTKSTVEIHFKYNRIAVHIRNYKPYLYSTNPDHLASTHQFVAQWSAPRFINWASDIDESITEYIMQVIECRRHPEQAFNSCLGILNLKNNLDHID